MARRFNAYLRGLLGLLDAKVEGRPPSLFSEELRMQLDALPFLFANGRQVLLGGTAASATETFHADTSQQVPAGELWIVFSHTVQIAAKLSVAGDVVQMAPAVQMRSSAAGILTHVMRGPNMASATNDVWATNYSDQVPYLLLPGDQPGVFVFSWNGAAQSINVTLEVVKVPI